MGKKYIIFATAIAASISYQAEASDTTPTEALSRQIAALKNALDSFSGSVSQRFSAFESRIIALETSGSSSKSNSSGQAPSQYSTEGCKPKRFTWTSNGKTCSGVIDYDDPYHNQRASAYDFHRGDRGKINGYAQYFCFGGVWYDFVVKVIPETNGNHAQPALDAKGNLVEDKSATPLVRECGRRYD